MGIGRWNECYKNGIIPKGIIDRLKDEESFVFISRIRKVPHFDFSNTINPFAIKGLKGAAVY